MNKLINTKLSFRAAGLFSTDEEWIHPERVESTYEIIYVTRGEVYMKEGEKDIYIKEGQLALLEPHVCHKGTRVTKNVSFYWVHFKILDGELPFEKRFFERIENQGLFKELLHWNNLPNSPEYLVSATLLHIISGLCWLSEGDNYRYDKQAEALKEWIRINADAALTVEDVAKHFGYTPDHVSRICRNNHGMGAKKLIDRFIIIRAKELLCNTEKYVKEIAGELGFSDSRAFIGYFKYHEGCSPSEYRKRFPMTHMNNK